MKKSTTKGFILGVICTLFLVSMIGTAFATSGTKEATLLYDNIKITLNGNPLTPKDANGKTVEPFIIDGTTYLPVRAIAEAMGLHVEWDGANKTAILTEGNSDNNSGNTSGGIDDATIVYVSNSGKYHRYPDCSGMKNYTEMTHGQACNKYTRCLVCW